MARSQDAELLKRIRGMRQPGSPVDGTITTTELAKIMACGDPKARRTLHELVEAGAMKPTRVLRRNIHGQTQPVSGFRVV